MFLLLLGCNQLQLKVMFPCAVRVDDALVRAAAHPRIEQDESEDASQTQAAELCGDNLMMQSVADDGVPVPALSMPKACQQQTTMEHNAAGGFNAPSKKHVQMALACFGVRLVLPPISGGGGGGRGREGRCCL